MDATLLSTVSSTKTPVPNPSLRPSSRSSTRVHADDLVCVASSSSSSSPSPSTTSLLEEAVESIPPFTPYSATVPWHTGMRAFFSQIFPRYGRYCGPNWSSGRSSGSLFWDKPPIDLLDYCCFCHDVGYDSHDQAQLYKADIALLECLQKMPPPNRKNPRGSVKAPAWAFRNVYIAGLQTFLLPYRRMLLSELGNGSEPQKDP